MCLSFKEQNNDILIGELNLVSLAARVFVQHRSSLQQSSALLALCEGNPVVTGGAP